jgi:hypothetical protein
MSELAHDNSSEKPQQILIKLRWSTSKNIPTIYSNELVITHAGREFYLVFGEVDQPVLFDPNSPPEYIEVVPVAKVAMTPENMIRFAELIQENIKNYQKKIGE